MCKAPCGVSHLICIHIYWLWLAYANDPVLILYWLQVARLITPPLGREKKYTNYIIDANWHSGARPIRALPARSYLPAGGSPSTALVFDFCVCAQKYTYTYINLCVSNLRHVVIQPAGSGVIEQTRHIKDNNSAHSIVRRELGWLGTLVILFLLSNDKTIMSWEFILVCNAAGYNNIDLLLFRVIYSRSNVHKNNYDYLYWFTSNNKAINSTSELFKAVKTWDCSLLGYNTILSYVGINASEKPVDSIFRVEVPSIICPEDGGSRFIRNVCNYPRDYALP